MSILKLDNVSKSYGKNSALNNICLEFETGRIYGLLGRNGAGKSTLINAICNRVTSYSGSITIDGEIVKENNHALGRIYAMSESANMPYDMKISSIFKVTKDFYPDFDIDYTYGLAKQFDLDVNKRLGRLSTGYKTISKIITALSSGAEYIFLDEPVLGLDANHRELFYKVMVERFIETQCCMIVSTHLIDEAANLFERVIIIDDGKITVDSESEDLLKNGYFVTGAAKLVDMYCENKEVITTRSVAGIKSAYIKGKAENVPNGLEVTKPDMQQIFISLTSPSDERM